MAKIELLVASQGQSNPMDADGIIAPQLKKAFQFGGLGHVVLGMHLEKAEFGASGRDFRQVR